MHSKKFLTIISLAALIVFFFTAIEAVHALTAPTAIENKSVSSSGRLFPVLVGRYEPPFVVVPLDRAAAKKATPEDAAISILSAMIRKDYDWWLQTWTSMSRFSIEQRDRALSRGASYWIDRWSLLNDRTIEIRYRADYVKDGKEFVLIGYGVKGLMIGDKEYESTLALEKQSAGWLATQELSADPVFNNAIRLWHTGAQTLFLP